MVKRLTVVTYLKNSLLRFCHSAFEHVAHTPSGNVNPHQPMLKGNERVVLKLMSAKQTQASANPHMTMPKKTPRK